MKYQGFIHDLERGRFLQFMRSSMTKPRNWKVKLIVSAYSVEMYEFKDMLQGIATLNKSAQFYEKLCLLDTLQQPTL